MRHHARLLGADEERWGLAGLIHDFDWERHPDAARHPVEGVKVLRGLGWPEDVCRRCSGTRPTPACRATRRWRRCSTPATSCAASWWPAR